MDNIVLFKLTDEQFILAHEFRINHECPISNSSTIGGRISYEFTPTGLGIIEVVKCTCGSKLDLTDYNTW